ncbi:hypothetical protein ACIN8IBEIGE_160393 [Acinetobacter sp. 8I-beige]|nr:hypothetical protein ACIN8IBEIGE_160393 [Acinetobacter sp. 8I-beige]
MDILFLWSLNNQGVTMKKHDPKLESVSKVIDTFSHSQSFVAQRFII